MKHLLMAIVAFIITLPTISYADQAVIKEKVWRGGLAYTVDVKDTEACLNAAKNISNLYQHNNPHQISAGNFYPVNFFCINSKGDIVNNGTFYQLPYSPNNVLCVTRGSVLGYRFNSSCDEDNFTTRAVLFIKEEHMLTLDQYIKVANSLED